MMANEATRLNLSTPIFTSYRAEMTGKLDVNEMETWLNYREHDYDWVDRLYIDTETQGGW